MSIANYKPQSRLFRNKRNWQAALAWVERERERLREYSLENCRRARNRRGLSEIPRQVAGPAEQVQVRSSTCQRTAEVRGVPQGAAITTGVPEGLP